MNRIMTILLPVLGGVCLLSSPASAQVSSDEVRWTPTAIGASPTSVAASFVYTNNDSVPNSVSAFSIASNGALTPVPGSPFLTGGNGFSQPSLPANRITTAIGKNFLYVSNAMTNSVSAFSIDRATGILTAVPGSPFSIPGQSGDVISLATTPNDRFLIATNDRSSRVEHPAVVVYSIGANGGLTQVARFLLAFDSSPDGAIKVTPNGKFLAVALSPDAFAMFSISDPGQLTPVPGPPPEVTFPTGVDCNCDSNRLFVGEASPTVDKIDVFNIMPSGFTVPISGLPFTGPGLNTNSLVLSPDDAKLFVSNPDSNTVTVFSVAPDGSLAVIPGSPFAVPGATSPSGMATNQAGDLLYVADGNNLISGYGVAANGALTPVPGSPFNVGFPGLINFGLRSLTVFPPKDCCPAPAIADVSANPDTLWPPNHKFVDVTINYSVTDRCPNACVLTVSSNEPVNGVGDGNTSPDWQVIDAYHVLLRSERAGTANERIYTITITCTNDTNRLLSSKTVNVVVPHDQGQ